MVVYISFTNAFGIRISMKTTPKSTHDSTDSTKDTLQPYSTVNCFEFIYLQNSTQQKGFRIFLIVTKKRWTDSVRGIQLSNRQCLRNDLAQHDRKKRDFATVISRPWKTKPRFISQHNAPNHSKRKIKYMRNMTITINAFEAGTHDNTNYAQQPKGIWFLVNFFQF